MILKFNTKCVLKIKQLRLVQKTQSFDHLSFGSVLTITFRLRTN